MSTHQRIIYAMITALVILPLVFYAQSASQIDALKADLRGKALSPLDAALTKVKLANSYIYHDLDSATAYIDDVLLGMDNETYILPDTFHRHLLIKAWTHQGKGEYTEAKSYLNKAIEKAQLSQNRDTHIELVMNLGALMVQTRDDGTLDFVRNELTKVDTTQGKSDYILYTLLHQYESKVYAQQEEYEQAIKTLLKVSSAKFLKKIPNYKYGIRTALSRYIAYMGDHTTAAKELELALTDRLHRHQKKDLYYELTDLKIKEDMLEVADRYLNLYAEMTPHTDANKRDMNYLAACLQYSKGDFERAIVFIDSSLHYQQFIQDHQKHLEGMLVKASLCEKKKDPLHLEGCILGIDTLLSQHEYLKTTKNLVEVKRIKLLYKLLNPTASVIEEFHAYEEMNAKLVGTKINPQLVAAVLAFDNQEKQYEIDQLLQTKELQISSMETQANMLNMSVACGLFFMALSGLYWWISLSRKRKSEELALAKAEAIEQAQQQNALKEKAERERRLVVEEAERERKQLLAQQKALESRVDNVESKKSELESRLKRTSASQQESNIIFSSKTKTYKIKTKQFMYAVAEKDGTRIYLSDKNLWLVIPLKEVLQHLPTEQFVRVFRSTVVNVDYINAVNSKYIVLENGEELALSRTYREEVRKRVG